MRAIVMKGMCLGAVVVLMGVSLHASAVTQPGVPEIATLEGRFVRAAYTNEGYVILGYQAAQRSLGEEWAAEASHPWVLLSSAGGSLTEQTRVWVEIDWARMPEGTYDAIISDRGSGRELDRSPSRAPEPWFGAGLVSDRDSLRWEELNNRRRT